MVKAMAEGPLAQSLSSHAPSCRSRSAASSASAVINPQSSACSAVMGAPKRVIWRARATPTISARRRTPIQPAIIPRVTSGDPNFADADRDAQIGRQGQFQSAAQRVAGERGNHRLGQGSQTIEYLDAAENPVAPHVVRRECAPCLDIAARAEEPSASADDDGP